jgi:hypothetical protein
MLADSMHIAAADLVPNLPSAAANQQGLKQPLRLQQL